jgi:acetyl esterase/lipase
VEVKTSNIAASYEEDGNFGIRVFEPQNQTDEARPAVVMYHGGGWSHGDPTNDDGLMLSLLRSYIPIGTCDATLLTREKRAIHLLR